MWSRSEKAMVVASVLASFQIMASAGSLRANSPFGESRKVTREPNAKWDKRSLASRLVRKQALHLWRENWATRKRPSHSRVLSRAALAWLFATAPNGELARGLRLALLAIIREHARRLATTATFSLLDHLVYMGRLKEIAALNFKSAKRISP